MISSFIGCPIHTAWSHIETTTLVNYYSYCSMYLYSHNPNIISVYNKRIIITYKLISYSYSYYYYYYPLIRAFHISVNRWFFTGVWVTASLIKSPGLFLVFWPFSIMLLFEWSLLVRQLPSPIDPLVIL